MGGSVTAWLGSLKSGSDDAISALWARYYQRMRQCARRAVVGRSLAGLDDEDIAVVAFTKFAERAVTGKFPELANRNQLWNLLSVITLRTAVRRLNHAQALKRGGNNAAFDAEFIDLYPDQAQGTRSIVIANEELKRLLEFLDDEGLQEVAILSMQGYSTKEISQILGSTQRTVQRMLALIRKCWAAEAERLGAGEPEIGADIAQEA